MSVPGAAGARQPSFRRGVAFSSAGAAISIAALFLEAIVAVQLMPANSYGVYVLLVAVVNFGVTIVDAGLKTAITKFVAGAGDDQRPTLVYSALAFRLAAIAGVSSLVWLGRGLLGLLDASGSLRSYAGYIPPMLLVASLDELLLSALQGCQAYRQMALAQIVRSVLRLGLTSVMLGVVGLGVSGLIYSWILSFAASLVYQYLALPVARRPSWRRAPLAEMLRFGLPIQLNRLLWFTFYRVDVLLLGVFAGPASVAFYEVAAKIPDAFQRLFDSFTAVYFPRVSALLAGGRRAEADRTLNTSLRLTSLVVGTLALAGVVFNQEIMTRLFSQKYAASGPVFAVLMLAGHMTCLVNLMGYTLTAAGHPGRSLGENLIRTALNVAGDLLLIPALGIAGPAYATLAASYAANPVAVWLLRRGGTRVVITPYATQALLLLGCAGLFWWFQPAGLVYKAAFVGLFAVASVLLATVSRADLRLVLPAGGVKLPGRTKEI
jgi:O-antigen/teichoic acid export membrane protein